jgi:hypothetical protein
VCGEVGIGASAEREQGRGVQATHQWSLCLLKRELDLHLEVRESHSTSKCHYRCQAWQAADGWQEVVAAKKR